MERELQNRWQHVQAVAGRAWSFASALDTSTVELLVASGFVHDIGYSPKVRHTGFHPIDGARYLRRHGFGEDIVGLVAHHTCAGIEAELRRLDRTLYREFPYDPTLPHDALLFCDLTTGPTGDHVSVPSRLAEVKERYGPDDIVHQFITKAEPELLAASRRAEAMLEPALV